MALHPIVEKTKVEVPNLNINVWFLDDGTLCGSPDDLLKALLLVEEDGPSRGLLLNRQKSLLSISEDSSASNLLPSEIPLVFLYWVFLLVLQVSARSTSLAR